MLKLKYQFRAFWEQIACALAWRPRGAACGVQCGEFVIACVHYLGVYAVYAIWVLDLGIIFGVTFLKIARETRI